MKKLITIILILAMLLPAAALATGDSPYFGRWVAQKHGSTGSCSAIIYYLRITEFTTCSYFELWIQDGSDFMSPGIEKQEMYAGHWEIVDNHILIPTSEITSIEVYYDNETDTLLMDGWPNLMFTRIP